MTQCKSKFMIAAERRVVQCTHQRIDHQVHHGGGAEWTTKEAYQAETAGTPESHIVMYLDPWKDLTLRERVSEGYGFGDYFVAGLKREQLQALADWMITLPEDIYAPIKGIHQRLERVLAPERTKR